MNRVKFYTLLSFLNSFALFLCETVDGWWSMVAVGVFGSTVVLGGGGTCLGEAGVFVSVQVFLEVQEAKRKV